MVMGMGGVSTLRAMTGQDLLSAHKLSSEQQWPHRKADWGRLLELGQGVVAECDGHVVGTTLWWTYGAGHAVIGMVIVANSQQGNGLGRRLMDAAIDAIGDRSILLNATDAGLSLYRALGFEAIGTIFQHQGAAFGVPIAELIPDERIAPMKAGEIEAIVTLDRRAVGMDRRDVVLYLCDHAQGVVLNRSGEQAGYALFRRFGRGLSIGPVVAPDRGGAKALITQWLGSNPGMFCRLDVPEESGLSAWLDGLGLPCVGRVTRMCRGALPPADPDFHVYSLANQALG
ncbi:MAG: GNAT family N-acetyltransferase [Sphingopyxis sp.]|nr:GNAT family N-acetyltransferase [Sphingopyxis sp.]